MAYGFPNVSFIGYPVPLLCPAHAGLGFRQAGRGDSPAVLDHLRALSPEDRRLRFCGTLSDAAVARHVEGLWKPRHVVISGHAGPLWAGPFHAAGPVRALAELALSEDTAELGLSVQPGERRRGVGTHLLQTAGRLLAPRGIARLIAYTLPGNASMLALARKFGAEIAFEAGEARIAFSTAALQAAYVPRRLAPQLDAPAA